MTDNFKFQCPYQNCGSEKGVYKKRYKTKQGNPASKCRTCKRLVVFMFVSESVADNLTVMRDANRVMK